MSLYYLIVAADDSIRGLILLIALVYLVVILWLAMYGVSNFINAMLYLRVKRSLHAKGPSRPPKEWPFITIQLPIYNEKYTVERLLLAVTQFCDDFDVWFDLKNAAQTLPEKRVIFHNDNADALSHLVLLRSAALLELERIVAQDTQT